jgi:DNA-binding GntR family transcriptional regulator
MAVNGGFEPVQQESTAALIARQLRKAIMYGHLAPGAQLSETELATQFGVSRGPLREAMQRLVQEDLLRSERNRGLFVNDLDIADIHDIYTARSAIEGAAVTLILHARKPDAVAGLRLACQEMTQAARLGDMVKMSDADLRFHEVLVAQSESPRLARMHQTLLVETRMCMTALQDRYRLPADVVAEHEGIIDAIEACDETLALKRLEDHMQDGLNRLARTTA